ncbi:Hsp70 family protein [Cupriavidus basilensis]
MKCRSTSTPTASCTWAPRTRRPARKTSITIKASSGLSEAEIERMVKDAEANAEEDKKAARTGRLPVTRVMRWCTRPRRHVTGRVRRQAGSWREGQDRSRDQGT